jgi:hypothetical protein
MPGVQGHRIPAVKQPTEPGRKIYPARCSNCGGKGRIRKAAD